MVSAKAKLIKSIRSIDDIEGEGFFSDLAAKVQQYLNPVLTSKGIYTTDIGIGRTSSVRQPIQSQDLTSNPSDSTLNKPPQKQGYFETLLNGRNNFPPAARAILKAHGDKRITKAVVIRQPVMSFNTSLLNMASLGAFQKSLDKQPYDTLFHLRSVFTLEDGTRVQVEKSEVIHIDTKITVVKGQQEQEVELPQEPMTINKFLEGAKGILKGNMYSYDGFKNNCQDFQMAMYRGADLLTPELATFIKQDVSEIAESSPIISKLANFVTGLGGKFNELYHGAGIKSINQRRPYVHIDHSGNDLAEKILKGLDEREKKKKEKAYLKSLPSNSAKAFNKNLQKLNFVAGRDDISPITGKPRRKYTKRSKDPNGGALVHVAHTAYDSSTPHQSYNPLDMKITTQNKMLNNHWGRRGPLYYRGPGASYNC